MTTISPAPTAYLLQKWERFFMLGGEQSTDIELEAATFTDAEREAWDWDIDHLIGEAHASEDAYLHALGERCERLAGAYGAAPGLIDDIRTGGAQCR